MRSLALVAALGALLASPAAAQDPAPAPDKGVKDPSRSVAGRIEEALRGTFSASAAGRLSARAALDAAVADWAAEAKDDPLRSVKHWRALLAATLPAGTRKTGIYPEKVTWIEGRDATLWVSIPKGYGPKTLSPMILALLDKGEEPKKILPALYGDLLKEWVVVAISADAKEAGIDIVKEPWLAALGLRWAAENLRVDRDRVVLDGTGGVSNLALSQGSEWAVQFAGTILRAPSSSTPLVTNLALGSVIHLAAEPSTDAQKKVAKEVQEGVPGAVMGHAGKGDAESVQKWLAAVPPRRIATAAGTFAWKSHPQGGEPWAYWLWVFRAADSRKERLVDVKMTRDAAGSTVDLQCDNLAEGILLLNDDILPLDRDVAIRVNGKEVWKGKPERQVRTALYWIGQTGERTLFVPAEIRFTVPADAQGPKKDGAGGGAAGDGAAPPPPPPPPPPPVPGDGGEDKKVDGDKPKDEKPKDEKPKDEKPKDEKPKDEKPKDEKPKDAEKKDGEKKD